MKRHLTYLTRAVGALFLLSGCTALDPCTDALRPPILFDAGEDGTLPVETRAMSARTSAAGFTCMAVTSSGTTFINNVKTTTSGSYEVVSGRYWPATGTLSFYGVLPNASMTNASGTVTVPVGSSSSPLAGTEDWIVAASEGVSNATSPIPMTFGHILAHIQGLTFTGSLAGATTTIGYIAFTHPTYGVYDLTAGTWSSKGGSKTESLPCPGSISGTGTGSSAPDLSVIPGTYTREEPSSAAGRIEVRFSASSLTKASGTDPVGNAPADLSGIASEGALRDRRFSLSDCPSGAMPMAASGQALLREGSEVDTVLSRSLCRVILGAVSAPFLSEGYAVADARIERVFLTDAPVDGALLPDGSSPSGRANEGGLDPALPAALGTYLLAERGTALTAAGQSDGTVLLCCPDPEGRTRLVLEASLDGESSYYGVTLPPLEANRSYEVTRLVLLGPGSSSPDTAPGRDPVSFSIVVVPWGETDSPAEFQ